MAEDDKKTEDKKKPRVISALEATGALNRAVDNLKRESKEQGEILALNAARPSTSVAANLKKQTEQFEKAKTAANEANITLKNVVFDIDNDGTIGIEEVKARLDKDGDGKVLHKDVKELRKELKIGDGAAKMFDAALGLTIEADDKNGRSVEAIAAHLKTATEAVGGNVVLPPKNYAPKPGKVSMLLVDENGKIFPVATRPLVNGEQPGNTSSNVGGYLGTGKPAWDRHPAAPQTTRDIGKAEQGKVMIVVVNNDGNGKPIYNAAAQRALRDIDTPESVAGRVGQFFGAAPVRPWGAYEDNSPAIDLKAPPTPNNKGADPAHRR
jgi:hypothetical protein